MLGRICLYFMAALFLVLSLLWTDALSARSLKPFRAPAIQSKDQGPKPKDQGPRIKDQGLSPEEQKVQQGLEAELKASAPTHRVWLSSDRFIDGQIHSESDTGLVLRQILGPNNEISMPYKKSEIYRIDVLPTVPVTLADVRLKMEFPALTFFKRLPYSVVTDESYFLVRNAMNALEKLHEQFQSRFAAWAGTATATPIQIVFFGNQADFRRYAKQSAPHLEAASGFYSTEHNRLVLFNQTASEDLQEFRRHVADLRQQWVQAYPNGLPAVLAGQLRELESRGLDYTYLVIRHEGAHQLLRSYGVLTTHPPIPWVEEGLAAFCETPSIGQSNGQRIYELKSIVSESKTIPWRALVDYQGTGGFLGRDPEWSRAAYAQSWLLVYSLMSQHPEGFFKFLKSLPDAAAGKTASKEPISARLARSLGLGWSQLESEWDTSLKRLTGE